MISNSSQSKRIEANKQSALNLLLQMQRVYCTPKSIESEDTISTVSSRRNNYG